MTPVEVDVVSKETLGRRHHIEQLLMKYPALEPDQKAEILDFIQHSPAIEPALLTCNDMISEQLQQFKQEFEKQLGFGLKEYALIFGIVTTIAALTFLLWNAGF
jgi:hypothetical protein